MKTLLALLALAVLCSSLATARTRTEQFRHPCASGSPMLEFIVFITYDEDSGCPISATGIDCNGTAWGVTFGINGTPGQTYPRTVIQSMNNSTLNVTAHSEVDFRVIDLQTGQYIGGTYYCGGGGQIVPVNISEFGESIYAVVSFQDGVATSLSQFVR